MKAYVLKEINKLQYIDIPYPECPRGWAIVRVKVAGICSSDIPRIFYKGTYHFPTVPGHELSGIVVHVGDAKDRGILNKSVSIFPLLPCKKCIFCQEGRYELCNNYDYIGSRRDGGFAEYVAVPVWNLLELPENISFKEAALMEPLAVALHAIKIGQLQKKESVAIVGTGMIGFSAAQWAALSGASCVTVIGRTMEKKKIADNIVGLNYTTYQNITAEYDLVIEAVGTNSSIEYAINLVRPGGRIVLIGNPSNDIQLLQNTYWRILRKQIRIYGTWNSSYESNSNSDRTDVMNALHQKRIQTEPLITHVFNQDMLNDGLEIMKNRTEPFCKIITIWN